MNEKEFTTICDVPINEAIRIIEVSKQKGIDLLVAEEVSLRNENKMLYKALYDACGIISENIKCYHCASKEMSENCECNYECCQQKYMDYIIEKVKREWTMK